MADESGRLTRGQPTIGEIYKLSLQLFNSKKVDNKAARSKLDITTARILNVSNFEYDRKDKKWKTTNKRSVKFEVLIKSKPVSYDKKDRISTHIFPLTLLMYSIEDGMDSAFKYRSGGLKKPVFVPPNADAEKRMKYTEQNIRNGTDLWFFFNLEWVLKKNNMLYGPCYANRAPSTTNPHGYIYFEKHSIFFITKILFPLLGNPTAISKLKRNVFKNEDRVSQK